MTKTRTTSLLSALLVLGVAAVALAAGEEHAEHHAPSITSILFPAANFVMFAWLLWAKGWPALRAALLERRVRIQAEIAEAERARSEAMAELATIEKLRAGQKQESERLVGQLRAEAEAQRQQLVESARRGAERILRESEALGRQEAATAARSVRARLAGEVVARATAALRDRFGDDDQRRAVGDFLTKVGEEARA